MHIDQHGNSTTPTGAPVLASYDDAVDHLLHFRPAVVESLETAVRLDPSFAPAQAASAYLGVLGTEPDDAAAARRGLERYLFTVDLAALLPRERMHLAAAQALVSGDLVTGGSLLRELVREHPRDALALSVGHQVDFLTGDAVALRDRIGGALTAWTPDDRHFGVVRGMFAFGLEETGLYGRSQDVGLDAVERDGQDVWGIHAVAHTLEMQGRFVEGLEYLDVHACGWQDGNFLAVHNWWHYCLYLLEAGDDVRPLQIYDAVLHNVRSQGLAMEMLDAAALLWRFLLEGHDETARWTTLATAWDAKVAEPYSAFNDTHAVMAYVGAGRLADAQRLVDDRERYVAEAADRPVTNVAMTSQVGLPVCRSLVAYGRGDYPMVLELLAPVRYQLNRFGGSHAQRDAVQRTLLEASLRCGQHDLTRSLLSERLGVNPCSPYSWLKQAALSQASGDAAAAALARSRAVALRADASPG